MVFELNWVFWCLIDLLHAGSILGIALKRGHVVNGSRILSSLDIIVVDTESKLDHSVDPLSVDGWVLQCESGRQERGLEQKVDEVLD